MDRGEIQFRWAEVQPLAGVAFLKNDAVKVIEGVYAGHRGVAVSLLAVEPEPRYAVQLDDAAELAELSQSQLLGARPAQDEHGLAALQRWYAAQCDGDWEHTYGIEIGTLDNPGWSLRVDLTGTALAGIPFAEIRLDGEREWLRCRVDGEQFTGYGGPHMLGAILKAFLTWAHGAGEHTA